MAVMVPCSMPVGTALQPAASHAAHHLLRQRGGRHIDLGDRKSQQGVAHCAADDARFFAVAVEHSEQARHGTFAQPTCVERGCGRRRHP